MDTSAPRIAVVGAGVVGLAAAEALGSRGAHVTTFDPSPPGSGQSFGRVRAFRIAHPLTAAVHLAVRALGLWREWETDWGQPLVRSHGLLTSDPDRRRWAASMSAAGQPFCFPTPAEASELCPLVDTGGVDAETLIFDPQAGAIDTRATIEWLVARNGDHRWHLVAERVSTIRDSSGSQVVVTTDSGDHHFDAAVVAAGDGTVALAADRGLHLETLPQMRTWATLRPYTEMPPTAMWMEMLPGHRYGWAQLGVDGAVALSGDWSSNDPSDTSAGSLAAALDYARRLMPGLDPATAREQQMLVAPVTVPGGMPFAISTSGAVTLIEGNQMFKFAPVLGQILADAVDGHLQPEVPHFATLPSD